MWGYLDESGGRKGVCYVQVPPQAGHNSEHQKLINIDINHTCEYIILTVLWLFPSGSLTS